MTDPKYTTPDTASDTTPEPVANKGIPVLTTVLAAGCVLLLGIIGYGLVFAVDEEPSKVEVEAQELPEVKAPKLEAPESLELEIPEAPELPETPEVELEAE